MTLLETGKMPWGIFGLSKNYPLVGDDMDMSDSLKAASVAPIRGIAVVVTSAVQTIALKMDDTS